MRIPAFFAAAALLAAAPALAAGPSQTTVRLGDLDLARPAGAHAAIARLAQAAAIVCAGGVTPAVIHMSDDYRRCRADTLATAVAAIHTPAATAAFDEHEGKAIQLANR